MWTCSPCGCAKGATWHLGGSVEIWMNRKKRAMDDRLGLQERLLSNGSCGMDPVIIISLNAEVWSIHAGTAWCDKQAPGRGKDENNQTRFQKIGQVKTEWENDQIWKPKEWVL